MIAVKFKTVMVKDEFNKIEVTNEKQVTIKEFGKTQKAEFSSHRDNEIPDEEYNKKIKFDTHPNHTNIEIKNKTQEVTKVAKVTSVNAANSIGAETASVATVGAVVAVTAISVVTGISVALHDYDFKFNSFQISSNEVIYDLFIIDNKQSKEESNYEEIDYHHFEEEEKGDFSLRVYNANYDYTNNLWLGSNYGSFVGLTLGETYNIVLSENRYGGETLFEESFTTSQLSIFNAFEVYPDANFVTNTISVYLDYLDEAQSLSDFALTLSNETHPDGVAFPLEKKIGIQEVVLGDTIGGRFDLTQPCHYDFSYKNKGKEIVFKRGEINFYNTATETSEFYQFIFDGSANYLTEEFYVRLDYIDDLNLFSEFTIILSDSTSGFEIAIPLDKTTDQQTINSQLYDIGFSNTYTYRLVCMKDGDSLELESGSVTFYDISGGVSEFNGITIEEGANFLTKTFTVQLFYQDDFGYYSNFRLIFDDEIEFALRETIESQTIDCSDTAFDLRVEHSYVLKCYNMGVEEILASGDIIFIDNSGAVSEFNELIFTKKADFISRTFDIALDYRDDFDYFSDFQLSIYDIENKESITFDLAKSNLAQTLAVDEKINEGTLDEAYPVDIVAHELTYSFSYKEEGNLVELIKDQELVFTNSNPSTFNGIESPYIFMDDYYNPGSYLVPMRYDVNDVMEIYNNLTTEILLDDEPIGIIETMQETYDSAWTYGSFSTYDGRYLYDILSSNGVTKVRVTGNVYDERTHSDLSDVVLYEEEITMSNESVNDLYGVNLEGNIMLGSYETMVMPVYTGSNADITAEIIFTTSTGKTYTYDLNLNGYNTHITLDMSNPKEGNFEEETFNNDFNEPVQVSIGYKTKIYTYAPGTSSDPLSVEDSPYYTIVCYDSFRFMLSA